MEKRKDQDMLISFCKGCTCLLDDESSNGNGGDDKICMECNRIYTNCCVPPKKYVGHLKSLKEYIRSISDIEKELKESMEALREQNIAVQRITKESKKFNWRKALDKLGADPAAYDCLEEQINLITNRKVSLGEKVKYVTLIFLQNYCKEQSRLYDFIEYINERILLSTKSIDLLKIEKSRFPNPMFPELSEEEKKPPLSSKIANDMPDINQRENDEETYNKLKDDINLLEKKKATLEREIKKLEEKRNDLQKSLSSIDKNCVSRHDSSIHSDGSAKILVHMMKEEPENEERKEKETTFKNSFKREIEKIIKKMGKRQMIASLPYTASKSRQTASKTESLKLLLAYNYAG
eukprot:TRINITY_DN15938_c0_g2_i6.p1 TRINITY_DN15938_c0_g2~~TRINITY_DN15938_c0_g2_i6.p1  ORF type:complete len:350 (-),score=75.49 TRINITY_DN15938_c0_g2_i6:915-1964(-)